MQPLRTAFVMEQALGHVTHYKNLRAYTDQQSEIEPIWLPIPFDVQGPGRLVPVLRDNWSVRASWRARQALHSARANGPLDAVFFHTQVTSLFSIGLMRRVPGIISLDATPINYDSVGAAYAHQQPGDGFLDRQKFRLNQRAFHAAAGLVAWSAWAKQSLVADYGVDPSRIRVLPPGAGAAYFEVGQRRQAPIEPDPARRVRLLFVGADFARKGGPLLLECMKGPLGRGCELHVVTQAEVPEQPNVIVHRGLTPNSPALLDLFATADVFVLPTRADCLGVALMEAAAAGLPVITTDVGALRESLAPDVSGYLVPVDDGRALVNALTSLVDDPERRQRMGRAAFAYSSEWFDARRNNRTLLDFIGQLADSSLAPRRAA